MGKVAVLGLGSSLELYTPDYDITIGVNDIWSKVKTDYVICLDVKDRFMPERLKVINESTPIRFYSHLDCWNNRPDFKQIELQPYYPKNICQLNLPALPKSHCSPFVACAIANNYLKADEIHLFGVDLINHPNLKGQTVENIITHFRNFKRAFETDGKKFVIHGSGVLKNI